MFALGTARVALGADDHGKSIVGTWQGTFTMPQGGVNIEMTLRSEAGKIVGEMKTPHGPWAVTEAKYVEGKWEILVRTPDNNTGQLKGVLSGDKLEGEYMFPPSVGGEFKMTRVKSAK
jgi:hypothetical protein